MDKSLNFVLAMLILWVISLAMIVSPLTTGSRIIIDDASTPSYVYSSPDEEVILTVGFEKATLYNLNLEKQGEFIDIGSFYRQGSSKIYAMPPVWGHDGKFVILETDDDVYYLSTTNLSVEYRLSRFYDLDLDNSDLRFQGYRVDDGYNLHYFRNNSLVQIDPASGIIKSNYQLPYNNLTLQYGAYHPEGRYVALRYEINASITHYDKENYQLVVLDLLLNKYTPIGPYGGGAIYFAPSKPYLAFATSHPSFEENITIYNIETESYGKPIIDRLRSSRDLSWSFDAQKILSVKSNRHGEYKRAYTESVKTYDVITGEKEFDFTFNRGDIYETSPHSYAWLSKANKLVILGKGDTISPRLIIQDINKNSITLYSVSNFAIPLFGIISSLFLLSLYIYKKPKLGDFLNNKILRRNDSSELEQREYQDYITHAMITLAGYYIISSILNFSMNVSGEYSLQVPITTLDIIYYSFLSFVDIMIILIIVLLNLNRGEFYQNSQKRTIILGTILIVLTLTTRIIQGYSFGLIDSNRAEVVILFIPFLIPAFIYWILIIVHGQLGSSITYHHAEYLSLIYLVYCYCLFLSV